MNRRKLLTTTAASLPVSLAGCAGSVGEKVPWVSSSPSIPSSMEVDRHYTKGESVLEDGLWERRSEEGIDDEYHAVIADRETAEERFESDSSVEEFIGDTDFQREFVIAVEYGMQSDKDLVLERIARDRNDLVVAFSIDSPRSVDDDWAVHSYTFRVSDEEMASPENLSIEIDGEVYT